jgi:hypothetical protein
MLLMLAGCGDKSRTMGGHNCANSDDDSYVYWIGTARKGVKAYASPEEASAKVLADGCTVHEAATDGIRACCPHKK